MGLHRQHPDEAPREVAPDGTAGDRPRVELAAAIRQARATRESPAQLIHEAC
jgi:hypothetical protein